MTSQITTLDHVVPALTIQTILTQKGLVCSTLKVAPRAETSAFVPLAEDQLLVVTGGEATVRTRTVSTVLNRHQALLVPAGEQYTLVASSDVPAEIIRVEVPPRQPATTEIVRFDQ